MAHLAVSVFRSSWALPVDSGLPFLVGTAVAIGETAYIEMCPKGGGDCSQMSTAAL